MSLSCSVQDFKTIEQMRNELWTNEISRDLGLRWRYPIPPPPPVQKAMRNQLWRHHLNVNRERVSMCRNRRLFRPLCVKKKTKHNGYTLVTNYKCCQSSAICVYIIYLLTSQIDNLTPNWLPFGHKMYFNFTPVKVNIQKANSYRNRKGWFKIIKQQ